MFLVTLGQFSFQTAWLVKIIGEIPHQIKFISYHISKSHLFHFVSSFDLVSLDRYLKILNSSQSPISLIFSPGKFWYSKL